MKVLVFGGTGFLGRALVAHLSQYHEVEVTKARIHVPEHVESACSYIKPDIVINCAGATGTPNVDWCESHIPETLQANTIGPLVLRENIPQKTPLIHVGSGCVFFGMGNWHEKARANPQTVYTYSKYASDMALQCYDNVTILRPRMPCSEEPGPRNLITKLARYKKVIDVANSVTIIDDFCKVVRSLIDLNCPSGVFHTVNPGRIRHRDILALYKKHVDPDHTCEFIFSNELLNQGLALTERSSVILENDRLPALGIKMRPIAEAMEELMVSYGRRARDVAA